MGGGEIGTDGLTYINTSSSINVTNTTNNIINYYGSNDVSVFNCNSTVSSFTNSGIILGGGGSNSQTNTGNPGQNGLTNSSTITILINTGSFLGGGGGGMDSGGDGGAGGGGGGSSNSNNTGNGGSIVTPNNNTTNGYPGNYHSGGGGPGGNGGDNGIYTGGIGGGGSGGIGSGSGGGNGGDSDLSSIFNFGGGGGAGTFSGGFGSGGGGYGGGDGGFSSNSSGGGGGGGGSGGFTGARRGGNGGYGINNSADITTLINLQGGTNYIYGPLFYCGNTPTNYNILINSTTRYGQLWCTGVTSTIGSMTFNIATGSILTTGTYSSVLKFNSGTVTLNNTSGTYQNSSWTLVQNGLYYDLVVTSSSLPCFKIGSKILTDKGYQLIENLRNGDLVKTLKNGYLPIVLIGKSDIYNSGDKERTKNQLYNLSCKNYSDLTEDLVLTGCHSILVDTITSFQALEMTGKEKRLYITDNKLRLFCYLDPSSDPYDKEGTFTIYHIALENENYYGNYGIYANGLLVESCSIRYLKELSTMILIE